MLETVMGVWIEVYLLISKYELLKSRIKLQLIIKINIGITLHKSKGLDFQWFKFQFLGKIVVSFVGVFYCQEVEAQFAGFGRDGLLVQNIAHYTLNHCSLNISTVIQNNISIDKSDQILQNTIVCNICGTFYKKISGLVNQLTRDQGPSIFFRHITHSIH